MLARTEPKAIRFDSFLFTYRLEETSSANDLQIIKIKYKPARPGIISHGSFTPWGGAPERIKKLQWAMPVTAVLYVGKKPKLGCSFGLIIPFLAGYILKSL